MILNFVLPYYLLLLVIYPYENAGIYSGFWYGETRPPFTQYNSVPYANMTVKINRPYQDGPGSNLIKDPFRPNVCFSKLRTIITPFI